MIRACSALLLFFALTPFFIEPAFAIDQPKEKEVDPAAQTRLELVKKMQRYEATLGWKPTENFSVYSDKFSSFKQCYFTGQFSLTLEYLAPGVPCPTDATEIDVFEYDAEAVAGVKTPLLQGLVSAPLGRFTMIVFHEDFHEQLAGIPSWPLNESATTLMGYLAARDFALAEFAAESNEYHLLARDTYLHLESAKIFLRYVQMLSELYFDVRVGRVSSKDALARKGEILTALVGECKGIETSYIGSCVKAVNNARAAHYLAYTAHYEMFYRLHEVCGNDTKKTGLKIIALANAELSEKEFIERVNKDIDSRCAK